RVGDAPGAGRERRRPAGGDPSGRGGGELHRRRVRTGAPPRGRRRTPDGIHARRMAAARSPPARPSGRRRRRLGARGPAARAAAPSRAPGAVVSCRAVASGRVLALEGDVERLTGYTHAEWLRLDPRRLVHPDDVGDYWVPEDTLAAPRLIDRTGRFLRADGSW